MNRSDGNHSVQKFCEGIIVTGTVGGSLKSFLMEELGISETFIEAEISAIFLDGHPVDDIETAVVKDGSQIALSGALPGLAGVSMRRKSPIASFRSDITCVGKSETNPGEKGKVTIKLFNRMVSQLGEQLLAREENGRAG
jgi:hypothetical protein